MMSEESHHSLFGLVVAVALGVVVGGMALTMALWMIGGLFHLLFFLVRLATFVALGAAVVWFISRRRERSSAH
jgi:hypothetical protein